jgi:hypothetical protein
MPGLAISEQQHQHLLRAFPRVLASDVTAAASVIPATSDEHRREFAVWVDGEELVLPYRIYYAEPDPGAVTKLAPRAQLVLRCLYTRHHDGHTRQRSLEQVVATPDPWIVPYVVQLLGEYVIEIIKVIEASLPELAVPGSPQRTLYGRFAADNPAFINLTAARATSYWNAYYRRYRSPADYPGRQLIEAVRAAGREGDVPSSGVNDRP